MTPNPPPDNTYAWKLGPLTIPGPLVLGPMAGYTSLPLRLLCHRAGAHLVYSEMVSARGLMQRNAKTEALLATCPEEGPVVIQLFGGEPEVMARAVSAVEAAGASAVDINMGCPVPKVLRSEGGAALMADPDRAVQVAAAVVASARIPVTAKIRAGWFEGDDSYVDLALRLQDAGVAALTIHGRSVRQGFRGEADHRHAARLAYALRIPVIASGDVFTPTMPLAVLQDTGCAGVMIARGAVGRPWVFAQAAAVLAGREPPPDPRPAQRFGIALDQCQLLCLELGERTAMHEMRAQLTTYCKGLSGSAVLRRELSTVRTLRQLQALFLEYVAHGRAAGEARHQAAP
jgi:tRNA-dihydrouridine synthase B